jgi:hypothetical protein
VGEKPASFRTAVFVFEERGRGTGRRIVCLFGVEIFGVESYLAKQMRVKKRINRGTVVWESQPRVAEDLGDGDDVQDTV